MIQVFSVVITSFFITNCATLNQDECRTADWRSIGFEDGSRGYSSQRIADHRQACAEYGITPILDWYLEGHQKGVRQYCVPSNGFALGRRGGSYNNLCPSDLEVSFLDAFNQGRKVKALESELADMDREFHRLEDELEALKADIDKNEAMIVSDATSPNLRRELLEQNKKLEELIGEKYFILERLQRQMDSLRRSIERETRF